MIISYDGSTLCITTYFWGSKSRPEVNNNIFLDDRWSIPREDMSGPILDPWSREETTVCPLVQYCSESMREEGSQITWRRALIWIFLESSQVIGFIEKCPCSYDSDMSMTVDRQVEYVQATVQPTSSNTQITRLSGLISLLRRISLVTDKPHFLCHTCAECGLRFMFLNGHNQNHFYHGLHSLPFSPYSYSVIVFLVNTFSLINFAPEEVELVIWWQSSLFKFLSDKGSMEEVDLGCDPADTHRAGSVRGRGEIGSVSHPASIRVTLWAAGA